MISMVLYLGCDHAAYNAKMKLIGHLSDEGYSTQDLGHGSAEKTNYPKYVFKVVQKVHELKTKGILLCGSGIGVSMAANRFCNIRAAVCRTPQEAQLSRQHNDSNILCLGARINNDGELWEITKNWLSAEFEHGHHQERIDLFNLLGEKIS